MRTFKAPNKDRILKNGDEIVGVLGYCALCSVSFGGSMDMRPAKFLEGKLYHPHPCYSQAVQMYLTDCALRKANG